MQLNTKLINEDDFITKECVFGGDPCLWIYPKAQGLTWTQDNTILRSSIWRCSDMSLVSPGFRKFFNWNECPLVDPAPTKFNPKMKFMEKIDGSCLIVSKYKGELITRTRKALVDKLDNGLELDAVLKVKYPLVFDNPMLNSEAMTLIFEWVTPSNRIVLGYDEPDLYLTNTIRHLDYSYHTQKELDETAKFLNVKRPAYRSFDSLEDLMSVVTAEQNVEGVCVYYGNEQRIRKIKSDWYNMVHAFKSDINIENLLDIFVKYGRPSFSEFNGIIMNLYGFENLEFAQSFISLLCDAKSQADKIIEGMQAFLIRENKGISRKDLVEKVFAAYGKTSRSEMLFTLLDDGVISDKQWKKLLFQCLGKA